MEIVVFLHYFHDNSTRPSDRLPREMSSSPDVMPPRFLRREEGYSPSPQYDRIREDSQKIEQVCQMVREEGLKTQAGCNALSEKLARFIEDVSELCKMEMRLYWRFCGTIVAHDLDRVLQ
jgi:hypothetical protein